MDEHRVSRRLWRRLSIGSLHTLAAVLAVIAMGIAADYGIGPVQAAVPSIGTVEEAAQADATTPTLPLSAMVVASPVADVLPGVSEPAAPPQGQGTAVPAVAVAPVGAEPKAGFVRIAGHVSPALSLATSANVAGHNVSKGTVRKGPMTLTLVLKRRDQTGFDRYMKDVYDSHSTGYQHFLSQAEITRRFGPSAQAYADVSGYLHQHGFRLIHGSKNRLTLTVRGSRSAAEHAFGLGIKDYEIGSKAFYANDADPMLPAALASQIVSISGLSNLALPRSVYEGSFTSGACTGSTVGTFIEVFAFIFAIGIMLALFPELLALEAATGAIAGTIGEGAVNIAASSAYTSFLCMVAKGVQNYFWYYNTTNEYQNYINSLSAGPYNYINPVTGEPGIRQIAAGSKSTVKSGGRPQALSGTSVTIGLLEFDTYKTSDVSDYLALVSSMGGYAGSISNLTEVPVNGGVTTPGAGEGEVLLDIDTVMSIAPGAKIVVYDAPFNGLTTDYSAVFNAMVEGGVDVISNSWASCEDQVTLAEVQGIDTVLQNAAASGITVLNGTGDSGSTCLDGSENTVSVPADSPSATAVGGTSLTMGPANTYGSETWWNGSTATPTTGQGGFGVSKFFTRPTYQNSVNSSAMRSLPDVSVAADPANGGSLICQADSGGCPTGQVYGGTSMSAPIWAAFAAALDQAQGKKLGALNPLLYPLANTNAFHTAASMGTDFSHVGLGSPNLNVMNQLLAKATAGLPDATLSGTVPLANVVSLQNGAAMVPADGASKGGVLVNLVDANGHTVSGKTVALSSSSTNAVITANNAVTSVSDGAAVFTITDSVAEPVTLTATDTTDGIQIAHTTSLTFAPPPAATAGISANPETVPADGQTAATIIVTLKDSLNRPSPGKTVIVTDAGAHAVITGPTPSVTDANGQIQFSATDQVNETVTFTATDVSDSLPIPGSGTITYSGSTATACNINVAPVGGTGYSVATYITGFPASATIYYGGANIGCPGANNPAFTPSGTVLVSDFLTGAIYQSSLGGGTITSANVLNTLTPALGTLVYGKDGSAYTTLGNEGASIVQINPTTGTIVRVVASGLTCPAGLLADPLSGDLFFDDQCTNGGTDNPSIWRIIDPANTDASNPTSVVVYATLPSTPNGGMAFAPNGTLYAVSGYYYSDTAPVQQISGTNSASVTVTAVPGVTSDYAVAIGTTNADGSAQSLIAEPAGTLEEFPISNPTAAVVLATGSPGVGVTGPDGCIYSARYDKIYRLANASGSCSFNPTSPAPAIKLTPATVTPNPSQGGSATFTAQLTNVASPGSIPVSFAISGSNPQVKLAETDATGKATIAYTGILAGADTVVATGTVSATTLASNEVGVTWTPGQHASFLTANGGPQGGTVNQSVTVTASLFDVSVHPAAAIPGQVITFALGGGTCTATTQANGVASCALTPSQIGLTNLTTKFAGTSQYAATTITSEFSVSAAPVPAPVVTLAVTPTAVAAGAAATLTWSSTNATACTASGSWSGNQATSGSTTVTPAATGSYSYTLSCSGNGGTSAATAVLSATLVAVTVSAKSGGGAVTWPLLLVLALLVALRCRGMWRFAGPTVMGRVVLAIALVGGVARADQPLSAPSADWSDPFYVGIRVGSMPVRLDASKINQGLASLGYSAVSATTDTSGTAGTVFLGYEFTPHAGLELAYTYRDARAAQLHGNIASVANLTPLLRDTTEMLRDYGNIVALSYGGHFEVAPRFTLEPRLGGFFWATKDTAVGLDDRIDQTHEGGGVTVGLTGAYRVWRGLELGVAIDHFRGFPNNIATFYGGTLEWRFGR